MKVLMVTPSYYPIIGGAETNVRNLSVKLNQIGVTADILTFNMNEKWKPLWKNREDADGFKTIRVPAVNFFSKVKTNPLETVLCIHVVPNLNFIKRLSDYDIIHFHDEGDLSFPFFSFFAKKPKTFHIRTLPSTFHFYKKNPLGRLILKNVANFYISQTNYNRKLLLNLGVPDKKIGLLPNSIDTKKFVPNNNWKTENMTLFVGRLQKLKGLHVLLKSLSYLEIPTRLVIIGPNDDSKYFGEILELARKENKKGIHQVEYLGPLHHNELVEWYQKAAIYVCPSLSESFPTVNLEALSCETPVVASKVGGIPEQVTSGINGILVPPNNPEKLAHALEKLLKDGKLREKYGKEGRRIVEQHFSWDQAIKKLIRIYETVLDVYPHS